MEGDSCLVDLAFQQPIWYVQTITTILTKTTETDTIVNSYCHTHKTIISDYFFMGQKGDEKEKGLHGANFIITAIQLDFGDLFHFFYLVHFIGECHLIVLLLSIYAIPLVVITHLILNFFYCFNFTFRKREINLQIIFSFVNRFLV